LKQAADHELILPIRVDPSNTSDISLSLRISAVKDAFLAKPKVDASEYSFELTTPNPSKFYGRTFVCKLPPRGRVDRFELGLLSMVGEVLPLTMAIEWEDKRMLSNYNNIDSPTDLKSPIHRPIKGTKNKRQRHAEQLHDCLPSVSVTLDIYNQVGAIKLLDY